MAPRTRVYATVLAVAAVVAGGVVSVSWLQARGPTAVQPLKKIPPLLFDFGLRNDRESHELAHGAALLKAGKREQAAAIFARYHDVQAQIGTAFTNWPDLDAVESIAAHHPDSPVAQLHFGLALVYARREADAVKTLRQVGTQFPDSPAAVDAENLLFENDIPGLPYIVVPAPIPEAKTLAQQVAIARRNAKRGGAEAKLVYGVVLWRLQHRVSARRELDAAARLAPGDPTVQTAAAVAAFTKRNPVAAFARLGPLTGRFPDAPVVRFHLGLLLLWTAQPRKGEQQLRLVTRSHPDSLYGKEAQKLLSVLVQNGTK